MVKLSEIEKQIRKFHKSGTKPEEIKMFLDGSTGIRSGSDFDINIDADKAADVAGWAVYAGAIKFFEKLINTPSFDLNAKLSDGYSLRDYIAKVGTDEIKNLVAEYDNSHNPNQMLANVLNNSFLQNNQQPTVTATGQVNQPQVQATTTQQQNDIKQRTHTARGLYLTVKDKDYKQAFDIATDPKLPALTNEESKKIVNRLRENTDTNTKYGLQGEKLATFAVLYNHSIIKEKHLEKDAKELTFIKDQKALNESIGKVTDLSIEIKNIDAQIYKLQHSKNPDKYKDAIAKLNESKIKSEEKKDVALNDAASKMQAISGEMDGKISTNDLKNAKDMIDKMSNAPEVMKSRAKINDKNNSLDLQSGVVIGITSLAGAALCALGAVALGIPTGGIAAIPMAIGAAGLAATSVGFFAHGVKNWIQAKNADKQFNRSINDMTSEVISKGSLDGLEDKFKQQPTAMSIITSIEKGNYKEAFEQAVNNPKISFNQQESKILFEALRKQSAENNKDKDGKPINDRLAGKELCTFAALYNNGTIKEKDLDKINNAAELKFIQEQKSFDGTILKIANLNKKIDALDKEIKSEDSISRKNELESEKIKLESSKTVNIKNASEQMTKFSEAMGVGDTSVLKDPTFAKQVVENIAKNHQITNAVEKIDNKHRWSPKAFAVSVGGAITFTAASAFLGAVSMGTATAVTAPIAAVFAGTAVGIAVKGIKNWFDGKKAEKTANKTVNNSVLDIVQNVKNIESSLSGMNFDVKKEAYKGLKADLKQEKTTETNLGAKELDKEILKTVLDTRGQIDALKGSKDKTAGDANLKEAVKKNITRDR